MSVAVDRVARKYLAVVAGVPISVDIPCFSENHVVVLYGRIGDVAVLDTDYTVTLDEAGGYSDFTVTPTASLITKINALIAADPTEANQLVVRRVLDVLTDVTPETAFFRKTIATEFDKTAMRFQQLVEVDTRALKISATETQEGGAFNLELPDAAARANKAIVFDADGNVGITADDYNDQLANVTSQAEVATTQAGVAAAQAAAALVSRNAADADAAQTALDRTAVSNDKATVAADKAAVAADKATTHTDKLAADADAAATAADRTVVAADKATVAADKTAANTSATNAATSEANALTYKNAAGVSEANAATSEANALTYKNAASTSATLSSDWAQKMGGTVDGVGYSAKYWAGQAASTANVFTFSTVSVAGQSDVVADQANDVVTFAAGTAIGITTNAATDTISFAVTDAELVALAGLVSAANRVPYFTGSGAAALLTLDTDGTLAGNSDTALASQKAVKTYVDARPTSTDTLTAGEAIDTSTGPKLVYKDEFDQRGGGSDRWWLVDSDAAGPVKISPAVALATTSAAGAGNTFTGVLRPAKVSGFTGLTAGAPVWAHSTPGALTQTAPSVPSSGAQNSVRLVGYAASTTEVEFQPYRDTVFQGRNSALAVGSAITVEHWTDSGARERVSRAYVLGVSGGGYGPALLPGAFSLSASSTGAGSSPGYAVDGNYGTAWVSGSGTSDWWQVDFGAGNLKAVSKVVWTANTGQSNSTNAYIEGSNDNSSFVQLYALGSGFTNGATYTWTFSNSTPYRYVRIRGTHSSANSVEVQEMQMYENAVVRDEPVTTGSEAINAAATDRVTVKFADSSDANQDTKTTFYNRTNATRDLIAEITLS